MCELKMTKDARDIWKRLFDHNTFLNGEVALMLNEFELKTGDKDVNELFSIVENLTDLKDTQIPKTSKLLDNNLKNLNQKLTTPSILSKRIIDLENNYNQDETIKNSKSRRKIKWDEFIDEITEKYSEINNSFQQKENELVNQFNQ